jgi:hypothetical protein
MTLTSELDDRDGRVRRFIDRCFVVPPGEIRRGLPAELRERLRSILLPPPEEIRGGALGTAGTGFDYRVRLSLEPLPQEPLAAHRGAAVLLGSCDAKLIGGREKRIESDGPASFGLTVGRGLTVALVREFFAGLDQLAAEDDTTLAQRCLVLALFEEVYRAAGTLYFDSPLLYLKRGARLDDLLELPTPAQVADLNQLWLGFADEVETIDRGFVCNPRFVGSDDIGGADADLLLGDCLLELKCSKRELNLADVLRQLLGYVLLDYDDVYGVQRVGVYSARQRALVTFGLHELLIEHVGYDKGLIVHTTLDGDPMTVDERLKKLRKQFRALLRRRR